MYFEDNTFNSHCRVAFVPAFSRKHNSCLNAVIFVNAVNAVIFMNAVNAVILFTLKLTFYFVTLKLLN